MTSQSRQTSPVIQGAIPHHTFSRGNCSAYGAAAKTNENWTTISDRAERRRVQNRIAQRAYRQKLKERLQLLERRAAQLSHTPPRSSQPLFHDDEACYNLSSNASTSSEDQCHHCTHHAISRTGTASPPSYASSSTHSSHRHSPNLQFQQPAMMNYFQDLTPQPSFSLSAPTDLQPQFVTHGGHDMSQSFPYLQSYGDMPLFKLEDELQPSFLNY